MFRLDSSILKPGFSRAEPPGAGRSIHEDLIVHALARVLLHGYISNIQVSWVKLGFEQSLTCLQAGANDFGGTLMEESISKMAGATFGEYVSPGEFRAMIRTIGRIPAERSTTYGIRKVFENPDAEESLPVRTNADTHSPGESCASDRDRLLIASTLFAKRSESDQGG